LERAKEALAMQRQTSALDRQIQKVSLDKARNELKVVQEGLTRLALRALWLALRWWEIIGKVALCRWGTRCSWHDGGSHA
jgi:hypothetical protein